MIFEKFSFKIIKVVLNVDKFKIYIFNNYHKRLNKNNIY